MWPHTLAITKIITTLAVQLAVCVCVCVGVGVGVGHAHLPCLAQGTGRMGAAKAAAIHAILSLTHQG